MCKTCMSNKEYKRRCLCCDINPHKRECWICGWIPPYHVGNYKRLLYLHTHLKIFHYGKKYFGERRLIKNLDFKTATLIKQNPLYEDGLPRLFSTQKEEDHESLERGNWWTKDRTKKLLDYLYGSLMSDPRLSTSGFQTKLDFSI